MRPILIIVVFLAIVSCKSNQKTGETIPSFEILLTDSSTRFNSNELKDGSPIAILYFSPDCEHCQEETKGIIQHMESLKDVRFLFVTNEPFDEMKAFSEIFELKKYSNIVVGRDEQFFMIRHFKGIFPPYMIVYNKKRHQIATLSGSRTTDELKSILNKI
jgi:hypothetical protein